MSLAWQLTNLVTYVHIYNIINHVLINSVGNNNIIKTSRGSHLKQSITQSLNTCIWFQHGKHHSNTFIVETQPRISSSTCQSYLALTTSQLSLLPIQSSSYFSHVPSSPSFHTTVGLSLMFPQWFSNAYCDLLSILCLMLIKARCQCIVGCSLLKTEFSKSDLFLMEIWCMLEELRRFSTVSVELA